MGDEKVKALFVYSFEDEVDSQGAAKVEIEGHAILNKRPDETKDFEVWSFDELYISNNQVEFKEPMLVSPVKDSQSEVPATEETPVDSKGDAK